MKILILVLVTFFIGCTTHQKPQRLYPPKQDDYHCKELKDVMRDMEIWCVSKKTPEDRRDTICFTVEYYHRKCE